MYFPRVARNQRLSFCLLKKVSHQINKCKSVRNAIPASAPGSANRKIRRKRALMPMNIPMPGKSKLLMRNPAERLISLTVRLPLWIRSVGNAVNLLMTILICCHSILVTSGWSWCQWKYEINTLVSLPTCELTSAFWISLRRAPSEWRKTFRGMAW